MAHDVFISYSSRNKPVADAVCAGLEAEKLRCWIAPRDVLPGQNYGESIVHAVAGCKVMVLLVSDATNVSQAVIREAERAMHHSKPIIPFRIEDVAISPGLEFFLASCHWLDAIHPPMDAHIAHLARSVKGLIGQGEAAAAAAPVVPAPVVPPPKAKRFPRWIAVTVVLLAVGGGVALLASKLGGPPAASPQPAPESKGLTLTVSLAGADTGAIASHFSSGATPRYQATEEDGIVTITALDVPVSGKVSVVSPADPAEWIDVPHVDLDLKLLNNGKVTAFFQKAVLEVTSSVPETSASWLVDGTRLSKEFVVRPFGGEAAVPELALGVAGPEDAIDLSALPGLLAGKEGVGGVFEFPLPRAPRAGVEETLFGKLGGLPFEIPFAALPAAKPRQAAKDPEPLYSIQLRGSGENYVVTCDLSQYIQAGQGDRFFLRLASPAAARHRFTVKLEYDDGSGGARFLSGPSVDASLLPARSR